MSARKSSPPEGHPEREVVITREFNAPRKLVFEAWNSAEHLKRWFAPEGCTLSHCTADFRPGGTIHTCIHHAVHGDCWCKGVYKEVVPHERIVYSLAMSDAAGNTGDGVPCSKDPEWPRETVTTVTFIESDGRTMLTLHQSVLESAAKRTGAHPSWLSMLDRLEQSLKK